MSETARLWTEISFNISYLIVIWWLVIAMWLRRELVEPRDRRTADLIMWAFAFLGFGDIGHVGFRVLAYAMGGLDATVTMFGNQLLLAPMGSLATAITFTIFYMALVMMWSARYNKPYGWFGYLLLALGVIRLLVMTHPANGWNSLQIAQPWSHRKKEGWNERYVPPTSVRVRPVDLKGCSMTLRHMVFRWGFAGSDASGRSWGYTANRSGSSRPLPTRTIHFRLQRTYSISSLRQLHRIRSGSVT